MTEHLDLPSRYRDQIEALLREHVPGVEVWAYGSRVSGRSHEGSDLDLVLRGPDLKRIPSGQLADLIEALEQSNVPIIVQIHDWARLPESFHREIEREYVVLVEKEDERCLAGDWQLLRLSDAVHLIGGGTPKRSHTEYWGGLIPWLSVKDFNNDNRHVESTEESITELGLIKSSAKILKEGQLIISARGTVGALAQLSKPMAFNQSCYGIDAKPEYTTNDFLYYLIKHSIVDFKQVTHGAVFDTITRETFEHIWINLPPLPEQRAIAHILGTLDDKIELNRRMNETLEEMARALFKSWFVDFDPVRAKMEGRDPGLPKHLADLFPNRLVDSELGPIPEGWEAGVLDDAIELLSGGTPRTSETSYWNGDIPWYTAKDAPSLSDVFVLDTERTITQAGVENSSTKIFPFGTTIITARGTVGRLACLGMPMAMNQTCYGIRGARAYPNFFTYWTIRKAVDELQNRTHGTIFDTITRQTFKIVDIVLPPVNVAEAFERTVNPIMEHILNDLHESRTLEAQRDALLPQLISGELRVESV